MTLIKFTMVNKTTKEIVTFYDAGLVKKYEKEGFIKLPQQYEELSMYDFRTPERKAQLEFEARRYKTWDENRGTYIWKTKEKKAS